MTKEDLPVCPVETAAKIIGSKWKLLILRELMEGTKRYNELRKGIPDISQKVLTENLKAMEADGIVTRKAYAEIPPRVEYSLSKMGASLKQIMDEMTVWGYAYQAFVRGEHV